MEWKNFDQNLIDKITTLTQKHTDHSPFEWFIVGFIYAHPSNNRILDKIFNDIHTVVSLSKTSQLLSIEDTNGILMKMVQNLLSPRVDIPFLILKLISLSRLIMEILPKSMN